MKKVFKYTLAICFFPMMALLASCTSQVNQNYVSEVNSKAKLIIKRPYAVFDSGYSAPVYVNNQYVGKLGASGSITWYAAPGQTVVSTSEGIATIKLTNEGKSAVAFKTVAGKTYYLNITVPYQINFVTPEFKINLSNS